MTTPTNSQIDAAVHGALGHKAQMCADSPDNITTCYEFDPDYGPDDCGELTKGGSWETCDSRHEDMIDYVNDPRLWWPLAEELLKNEHCLLWWKIDNGYTVGMSGHGCLEIEIIVDKDPGRAVCLAWLEMKGVKVNG